MFTRTLGSIIQHNFLSVPLCQILSSVVEHDATLGQLPPALSEPGSVPVLQGPPTPPGRELEIGIAWYPQGEKLQGPRHPQTLESGMFKSLAESSAVFAASLCTSSRRLLRLQLTQCLKRQCKCILRVAVLRESLYCQSRYPYPPLLFKRDFHPMVHSLNDHRAGGSPKPGTRSFFQISQVSGRVQNSWAIVHCFPTPCRELNLKWSGWD